MLFRITQEALSNTRKHAKATKVKVSIRFIRDKVRLRICDDGNGFKVPRVLSNFARQGKLGMLNICERARSVDGNMKVKSKIGKGTTLEVEVPIRK